MWESGSNARKRPFNLHEGTVVFFSSHIPSLSTQVHNTASHSMNPIGATLVYQRETEETETERWRDRETKRHKERQRETDRQKDRDKERTKAQRSFRWDLLLLKSKPHFQIFQSAYRTQGNVWQPSVPRRIPKHHSFASFLVCVLSTQICLHQGWATPW